MVPSAPRPVPGAGATEPYWPNRRRRVNDTVRIALTVVSFVEFSLVSAMFATKAGDGDVSTAFAIGDKARSEADSANRRFGLL
jgi:hypothetical protein